jgi:hypothetical protein
MRLRAGVRRFALFAVAFVLVVIPALSQTPAPTKKPAFEVASV